MLRSQHELRPGRLRRVLRRVADPRLVSWPSFWISWVVFTLDGIPLVGGIALDGTRFSSLGSLVLLAACGQGSLFALLVIARLSYLPTPWSRRHPAVTVWTLLLSAIISDVAVSEAAIALGVQDPIALPLDHALYTTVWLCVIGAIAIAILDHRSAVTDMETVHRRLFSTRNAAEGLPQRERVEVVNSVTALLKPLLAQLSALHPEESLKGLRTAASAVIRPLSHELAAARPDFAPAPVPPPSKPPWSSVLAQVVATPLVQPLATAAFVVLLAVRFTIRTASAAQLPPSQLQLGPLGITVDVASLGQSLLWLAVVFTAMFLSAKFASFLVTTPSDASWSHRWAMSLVSIVTTVAGAGALVWTVYLIPAFPNRSTGQAELALVFTIPVLSSAIIMGVLRSVALRGEAMRAEADLTTTDLHWEVAKTNEALWHMRRELSRMLHGPVQAALVAGVIQLDTALSEGRLNGELMDQVRTRIQTAMHDLQSGRVVEVPDIGRDFEAIRNTWSGACAIDMVVPREVMARLEQDHACAAAVAEIVGEACANAAIHGRATRATVTLQELGPRSLELVVADDGDPGVQEAEPGLGREILDEVATSWSLTASPTGATLRVVLPIGGA